MLFASVLVIVGAGVAAYRSGTVPDAESDVLVLLGPALVGLALGQIAIWLLRLVARGATGATSRSGLAGFLATRRLSRADDLVTPMRLLVAAAVVGVLALTGASSVTEWVDEEARIAAGGPVAVPVENGAVQAMALTRDLDPEGEHLMAVAVVPNETRLAERRAYVDAARFEAVAGDFYADTPAAEAATKVPGLVTASPDVSTTADRFTVTGRLLESQGDFTEGLAVRLDYVTGDDSGSSVEAELRFGEDGTTTTELGQDARLRGRLPDHRARGHPALPRRRWQRLQLRPQPLPRAAHHDRRRRPVPGRGGLAARPARASNRCVNNRFAPNALDLDRRVLANRPDGLEIEPLPDSDLPLTLEAASAPTPVLVAGAAPKPPLDVSGDDRVLGPASRLSALPLLGTRRPADGPPHEHGRLRVDRAQRGDLDRGGRRHPRRDADRADRSDRHRAANAR